MKSFDPTDVIYLSREEEKVNVLTHGAACVLSLVAAIVIYKHPADPPTGLAIAASVYTFAMAAVYFCSTMSHAVLEPSRRNRWRAWDQGMIYSLIAGTYTPFIYACSPEGYARTILIAVWVLAAIGFYSKVLAQHRVNGISTLSYILLGWLPAIPLVARTPFPSLLWMVLGGVCYTVGIGFLRMDNRVKYFHGLWHLMVIAGSTCHFVAIFRLLTIFSN